jgi:hypothetical protein
MQEDFIHDRLVHLGTLHEEAAQSDEITSRQQDILVTELNIAIDALHDHFGV